MLSIRSVVMGALSVLAAGALTLGLAASAGAHDELVASDPRPGERLAVAPAEVTLVFTGNVLDVGAAVVVADESGRDWVADEPSVALSEVLVPLETGMPDAGYEVRWRVVSEDGHPISGIVPFTVGDGAPFQRAAAGVGTDAATDATVTNETSASVEGKAPQTDAQDRGEPDDQDPVRIALVGVFGAIVAIGAFLVFSLARRRAHTASAGDGR